MAQTSSITSSGIKQPYYVPGPSPWPIIGSISAFVMFLGAVTYLHPDMWSESLDKPLTAAGPWVIAPGVLLVLFTMYGWWSTVTDESSNRHALTPPTRLGLRYAMFLFIASEVMFFVAFFWAFFNFALYPEHAHSPVWPPASVHVFNPWALPFLNTLILLTSGTTVTWAHHGLRENNRKALVWGLVLTIALGISFTCCQAWEYSHAPFAFKGGVFPSTFFMATGFHGFHVIIGTTFLTVCLIRALKGQFTPQNHFGFEAAAWYWHFVDVVWLFLFTVIYWWGSVGATLAE